MQTQEPGERARSRSEIVSVQAKRVGLRLVSGGLWLFAAAGAILTIGAGIAVCLLVSDKEFSNAAAWLGIGLVCAAVCAACGYIARRTAERVAAMDPRTAPVIADANGTATFDGPLYASEKFLQAQTQANAVRLPDTSSQGWQEQAREQTGAQASAEEPRNRERKPLPPRKERLPAVAFVEDRFYPLLLFIAGVTMVVWNHISILHHHILFYYAIFCGPPALWGGLAALFDPHVINSHLGLTPLGRRLFLAAIILSVLSVIFLIWLYAVYYQVR